MPICNGCDFVGSPDEFPAAFSAYHDFKCPQCGTTNVDTADINKAWAKKGVEYGYGDGNVLDMSSAEGD